MKWLSKKLYQIGCQVVSRENHRAARAAPRRRLHARARRRAVAGLQQAPVPFYLVPVQIQTPGNWFILSTDYMALVNLVQHV